ncbi:MAG: patatin-like phospholipase family protein [Bacillota bacterium]
MKKPIALVLGGGGGKGAYQIGVWQALREYGVDKMIGGVAGTSVGALNAALFAQNDYEAAARAWESVNNDKILHLDKSRHFQALKQFNLGRIFFDGIFSNDGLRELMETYLDLEKVSRSPIPAFATCCPVPKFSFRNLKLPDPVYFRIDGLAPAEIAPVLLASSAIPFVFDAIQIGEKTYVDGGLVDNVPIRPLYDLGFRRFIVINLDMYQRLPREKYRDADIIEIMPDYSRTENITDVLDFSPAEIQAHIQEGYGDAMQTLSSRFKLPARISLPKLLKKLVPTRKLAGE